MSKVTLSEAQDFIKGETTKLRVFASQMQRNGTKTMLHFNCEGYFIVDHDLKEVYKGRSLEAAVETYNDKIN